MLSNTPIKKSQFYSAILFLILLIPFPVFAQFNITGEVFSAENNRPLQNASIKVIPGNYTGKSNTSGHFSIHDIPEGNYSLSISYIGFDSYTETFLLLEDKLIQVTLKQKPFQQQEIIINATRVNKNEGYAFTDIDKTTLQKNNTGKDLPYLLELTPSLVTTSDAGGGVGYTGVRIRGSDGTRINVTLNGIPLNDAESQAVYFVDLPDLGSSIENIQVQRGVGTSTNGAAAFGGSINMMTNQPTSEAYASTSNAMGTYNTFKNNFEAGTGLIKNHWNFEGRLSRIKSNGYIDRASSDLKSYYLSGGYFGNRILIKYTMLSGKEITYQAWNGVPENLLKTNRTFNSFTYENQVDNYKQDHFQLLIGFDILKNLQLQVTLHKTKGKGYYEEYKSADDYFGDGLFSSYGLPDLVLGTDTIKSTDLVRRKWLDNNFTGSVFALTFEPVTKIKFTLGGAWSTYQGKHFAEIIWARFAGNTNPGDLYENDKADKKDFNIYLKCYYTILPKLDLTLDMQLRTITYHFNGFDVSGTSIPAFEKPVFINPKLGINWTCSPAISWYASLSRAGKEPSRDDYIASTINSRPRVETMTDLETGFRFHQNKISATVNYYLMNYQNQLVLTGKVNDVGNYTRVNVPASYRQGIETEINYRPYTFIGFAGNVTLSENKIKSFTEYIDNYDDGTQQMVNHKKSSLAFSPVVLSNVAVSFYPVKNLDIGIIIKHVGKQYLDNTSNNNRKINDYTTGDIRVNYALHFKSLKAVEFSVSASNIWSKKYVSNGYTFSYISAGEFTTENYYYPQALIHFMGQITLKF